MSNIIIPGEGRNGRRERTDFTQKGMITMSNFHMLAQQFNWSIRCESCGQPVQGENTGNAARLVMTCGCREYICDAPNLVGRI